ncbi:translation initiation factor eIF-2B subunit alpha [Tilletia horrida]|uniref:Translation initiation factor eIF2B subunit alpha n=1 Tax=Tilletia horrida TaxID=155126 RepID=A0AAN6GDB0_9BASI|nr:translation initiation factor eIF-2B subunit alpha [Tilletia horrida]KAK0560268.1 translation initiation factor eIF-2B subunit alpha [Tilletia horrida]
MSVGSSEQQQQQQQQQAGTTSSSAAAALPIDVVAAFETHLTQEDIPAPIAALLTLCDLLDASRADTTAELIALLRTASHVLKASLPNPVPASAGLDLMRRFVITQADRGGDFDAHRQHLVALAREFAANTVPSCREKIIERALPFIREDAVILTHSYSRVVIGVLKTLAQSGRRVSVYVTESRPHGLGLRTYDELTAAGVPCTVILDSAVAYIISRVDLVLVGAEGIVESGGVLNALGTYQMALVAKHAHRPFYACAESYKMCRLFPLSQADLPTTAAVLPFAEASASSAAGSKPESQPLANADSQRNAEGRRLMTREMEAANPKVDYTLPQLISFIISDVGVLTPSGVADALLAVYGGSD